MAYICKTGSCQKRFSSTQLFWSHARLHSPPVSCPIANCRSNFNSKLSLNTHISRDHKRSKSCSEPVNIVCPVNTCSRFMSSRTLYLKHMPLHLSEGHSFVCGYSGCKSKLYAVQQFRVHMSRVHSKQNTLESPSTSCLPGEPSSSGVCDNPILTPNAGAGTSHSQPQERPSNCETNPPDNSQDTKNEDLFQEPKIKDEFAKFYLRLESEFVLPSSTVQVIAERIKRTTELSHHCLKRKLRTELENISLDDDAINSIISKVFKSDPIFNIHHKFKDFDQLGTHHLRQKYWKTHYPYVEPKQVFLGVNVHGKNKYAHYFSIRDTLATLLKDPVIKAMVLQSFEIHPQDADNFTTSKIFSDFTDGSAFADHMKQHSGKKCLLLFLFQDAFDFAAFGPSQGTYKPIGFYYSLGNIRSEYRTKLGCIQIVYLVLEKYFKATLEEDLKEVDKLKEILKPLLDELEDLKINGIEVDGETIPVCLMFGLGDNAGQHFIGRYVQSFTASYCCRFCPTSTTDFKNNPAECQPFRTPAEYDEAVSIAKEKWHTEKEKALNFARRQEERMMEREDGSPGTRISLKKPISKNAHKKLNSVHKGVKFMQSPLNSDVLQFHSSSPSLVVCIAHDLFEGIVKNVLPAILKYFEEKKWFDLELLNRRIKSFTCEGNDKHDAPTPLKSFDSLGGNASENWTLLRNLPFMIEDLIVDKENEMWCFYLQLKEIVELVTAPKIALQQVLYLKTLIREYLLDLSELLPSKLTPKQHYLLHYPDLIVKFGPLIRLFTLRFESKHVFFKNVAKACKNYINITYTLARKYACKFALDNSDGLLPPDVSFDAQNSIRACDFQWSSEQTAAFHPLTDFEKISVIDWVEVYGVLYRTSDLLQLALLNICDLQVGKIERILVDVNNNVGFLLDLKTATNSFSGYYEIDRLQAVQYQVKTYEDLIDYYPLPIYKHAGKDCFTLKHSAPFVLH